MDTESTEPAAAPPPLRWSAQFTVGSPSKSRQLPGDKILLPASALEQLLAAAPTVSTQSSSNQPHTSTFDPFNPHTFAAERHARELQYQDRVQQLPHPLTFRLVNPDNGKAAYAGIREFSADDGEVVLSKFLRESLGVELDEGDGSCPSSGNASDEDISMNNVNNVPANSADNDKDRPRITVHAHHLPKGTFVKLRPLEAGYDPADWKSLLEQHMRTNFTTLTNGELLVIPGGRGVGGKREQFRFLIDGFRPEGDGICVVDTDLEVDIEALNEEQARETLKKIAAKAQKAPGTTEGSSTGGELTLVKPLSGQVLDGEYVDYEVPSWIRSQGIEIELSGVDEVDELDLYVSPFGPRQRAKPRAEEHVFADVSSTYPKRVRLRPTNVELEDAEFLWVSVHAYSSEETPTTKTPKAYQIRAFPFDPQEEPSKNSTTSDEAPPNPGDVQCKNCQQWVPERSLFLHENFCLRNNVICPKGCGQVFQKQSETFKDHWHCPHDTFYGNTTLGHFKHDAMFHQTHVCDSCDRSFSSLAQLAHHKTTVCPGKHILCQFCHLEVPQEGNPDEPNPEALLSNLTPHELADGGRTTECHLCNKIIRLRDMATHSKHHEFEKLSRPPPRICRNVNCGRTLDGATKTGDTRAAIKSGQSQGLENDLGLCGVCFGPLYVSMYDPEGKALRRRVERRYLTQLTKGCEKKWCRNETCKTGRHHQGIEPAGLSMKEALPLIKPLLEKLQVKEGETPETPVHFCTDESSHKKRNLAEMLAAEEDLTGKGGYSLEWCIAAMEAEGGDLQKGRDWLKGWAPQRSEAR